VCTHENHSRGERTLSRRRRAQWGDKRVEVFDNWANGPGAVVVTNGVEATRERKLLAWAGDYVAQRFELARAKAELSQVSAVGAAGAVSAAGAPRKGTGGNAVSAAGIKPSWRP
jgi:translation initiation factor 6 (eIF-6)